MASEERRSARLLLGPSADEAALRLPAVRRALRSRRTPPAPVRLAQALALRRGLLSLERNLLAPLADARRQAFGPRADIEAPRLLVRVDEFPHARAYDEPDRYGNAAFRRFHETMRRAGVPYLLAVTPRPCHAYLDPHAGGDRALSSHERELLVQACTEGVEPAVHGLTHRTRDARPRHHSELCGLPPEAVRELLARADKELARAGTRARVFVPPFNRFDSDQYPLLAERYEVVCGGPESVPLLGFRRGPLWLGDAVYLPSYPPLYDRAARVEGALGALAGKAAGVWLGVTLHLGWEADAGWQPLERLAAAMAPHARPWSEFLDAVAASRDGAGRVRG